jgi:type II secretory pathway pseudopilin PulG
MDTILIYLLLVLVIIAIVLIIVFRSKKDIESSNELEKKINDLQSALITIERALKDDFRINREESAGVANTNRQELQKAIQEFVYDNYTRDNRNLGGSVKNLEEDYKRIATLTVPTGIDYLDRITSGIYGSVQHSHDLLSKKIESKNFDMMQSFKNKPHLNEFPAASAKAVYRYGSRTMFSPKYFNNFSNYGDVTNTNTIQERTSLLKQAESTKLEITVPGRMDYTVGKKVYLKLNKVEPISKKDKDTVDKMFSGNYLISAVNHFITREKHECTLELIKDSLMINLDGKK